VRIKGLNVKKLTEGVMELNLKIIENHGNSDKCMSFVKKEHGKHGK
jgi:hypothetical protein